MVRRQMCVPADHFETFPSSEFLKHVDRSSRLNVPRGPRVPKIVPPEVLDSRFFQCRMPRFRIDLPDRVTLECENAPVVLPDLPTNDLDRGFRKRHSDRLARLCLVGVNPDRPAGQVDLGPFELEHVSLTESRQKGEFRDRRLVRRQQRQKPARLGLRDPPDPAGIFLVRPDDRRMFKPIPRHRTAQHFSDELQIAIRPGFRNVLLPFLGNGLDEIPVDLVQEPSPHVRLQPAQHRHDIRDARQT